MAQIPFDYDTNTKREGHSSNRAPYFDGTNYGHWKTRMEVHLLGMEKGVWKIVRDGFTLIENPDPSQQNENDRLIRLDALAKGKFYDGLHVNEFNKISSCSTSHAIWTRLGVIHDGTSQVKKTRLYGLKSKFDSFKMLPNESINDMLSRFNLIMTQMQGLGHVFTEEDLVVKVLYSLTLEWNQKRTAIEEAHDLASMTFEELMGKLMAYEEKMEQFKEGFIK